MIDSEILVPFLKWAGGKRWALPSILACAPDNIKTYVEPFLGSGSVFFALKPKKAVLSDLNPRLIETYDAVRTRSDLVNRHLRHFHKSHNKNFYYEERARIRRSMHSRAAQFIYLNRTCWNGLYRVNKRGQFNVPIGTKTAVYYGASDLAGHGKALQVAALKTQDFQESIDAAKAGDFIFADPPYTVKHNLNGFVKYNETLFSWDDQIRLRDALARAAERGVSFALTNANHEAIHELYEGIGQHMELDRASVLSGKAAARQRVTELLVNHRHGPH